MPKQPITPILLLLLFLLTACGDEADTNTLTGNEQVEVQASIHQTTRSNLAGTEFVDGDSFILYEGTLSTGKASAEYTLNSSAWTGELYWDDLDVWDSGVLTTDPTYFTAIMANGGDLTIATNQNVATDAEFLKNDLLVAYANAKVSDGKANRKLSLEFKHVFARLVIKIAEVDVDDYNIMGAETVLTLNGIKTVNTIAYDPTTAITTVTPDGATGSVTLRNVSTTSPKAYIYEAIIPAQSLETGVTLTINNNENGKTYTYDLSAGNIKEDNEGGANISKDKMLQQGHITTLKLKIEKTEVQSITATVKDWVTTTSSGTATPSDYPEIIIGGGSSGGGDDDGKLDPTDDYAGKTIKLDGDIDASKLSLPIGSKTTPFRGTFDGQGHTIYGIDLDTDVHAFLGVFGYTDGATIRNLKVKGRTINNKDKSTSTATGGLAGYVNNTLIENCHVLEYTDGVNAAYDNAGGLVGYVNGSTIIRNSSASTDVSADHDYVGGFVGKSEAGMSITECFATGKAIAKGYYAGGFAGYTYQGTITFSYAWGSVEAARYAGGFIGRTNTTTLTNSYAAGRTIAGGATVGGLIGYSDTNPKYCYWNAALAGGRGATGNNLDATNSSFTLLKIAAGMGTVLNGLNRVGNTQVNIWGLGIDQEEYVLPVLINNKGGKE